MYDDERTAEGRRDVPYPSDTDSAPAPPVGSDSDLNEADPDYDESLTDELAALIDDGRTYAEAEIAFQKTRAKLAGRSVGKAIGFAAVALITLHIAVLALAVGMVIALEPLVTIWGAIAIVVGVLLAVTVWLVLKARNNGSRAGELFSSGSEGDQS